MNAQVAATGLNQSQKSIAKWKPLLLQVMQSGCVCFPPATSMLNAAGTLAAVNALFPMGLVIRALLAAAEYRRPGSLFMWHSGRVGCRVWDEASRCSSR
jgi:hypothetical protein